jgi:lambda repressor-like predicted transcriptional regulator
MQPWRRALKMHGLTLAWLARQTGRSRDTVRSYSIGRRTPPPEWIVAAHDAIEAVAKQEDES